MSYLLFLQHLRQACGGIFDNLILQITSLADTFPTFLLLGFIYWCTDKEMGIYMAGNVGLSCTLGQYFKWLFRIERPWVWTHGLRLCRRRFPMPGDILFPAVIQCALPPHGDLWEPIPASAINICGISDGPLCCWWHFPGITWEFIRFGTYWERWHCLFCPCSFWPGRCAGVREEKTGISCCALWAALSVFCRCCKRDACPMPGPRLECGVGGFWKKVYPLWALQGLEGENSSFYGGGIWDYIYPDCVPGFLKSLDAAQIRRIFYDVCPDAVYHGPVSLFLF